MKKQIQTIFQRSLIASCAALAVSWAFAADVAPNAGSLLQQVPPTRPNLPTDNSAVLPRSGATHQVQEDKTTFLIQYILIEGNTTFSTEELHALVADQEGLQLGVNGLNAVAQRITDYYHQHGYFLSRAVVPAQKITDDSVRIQVLEARVGHITLHNNSDVSDSLLQSLLDDAIPSGEQITQSAFEQGILLVRDLPNMEVDPQIKPGSEVGQSDVDVTTSNKGSAFATQVGLDNGGNAYTGRWRANAGLGWFNPLGFGDVLNLNVMGSGSNMNYTGLSYETALGGQGLRAGASKSAMHYTLGGSMQSLGGHGSADVSSGWLRYPVQRSVNNNLNFQLQADHTALNDLVDTAGTIDQRHIDTLVWSLSGDHTAGDDVTNWRVGLSAGLVNFDNAVAQVSDSAGAHTQGSFDKLNANLTHLMSLTNQSQLYVRVNGLFANKNLDASQKLIVGGPNSVRAYDVSTLAGDRGLDTSVEWRNDWGLVAGGQMQGQMFFDYAAVTSNASPWVGFTGSNTSHLAGVGVGALWVDEKNMHIKVSLATPIGNAPSTISTPSHLRGWLELGMPF